MNFAAILSSPRWFVADPARTQERTTQRMTAMVGAHGGPGTAVISYLGNRGYRIVAVAADGTFGDAVVPSAEVAEAVCAAAGLPVGDWDRTSTTLIAPTSADRYRMAGTGR